MTVICCRAWALQASPIWDNFSVHENLLKEAVQHGNVHGRTLKKNRCALNKSLFKISLSDLNSIRMNIQDRKNEKCALPTVHHRKIQQKQMEHLCGLSEF